MGSDGEKKDNRDVYTLGRDQRATDRYEPSPFFSMAERRSMVTYSCSLLLD